MKLGRFDVVCSRKNESEHRNLHTETQQQQDSALVLLCSSIECACPPQRGRGPGAMSCMSFTG